MDRFTTFRNAYENALAAIVQLQKPHKYEPHMDGLVNWMLTTDANPYAFLPEGWAGALSTAEGFADLLHTIHHALYDDGDITFVTVKGEPRIVFAHRFDDGFRDRVLTHQELELEKQYHSEYTIEILDIKPNEFGPLYDAYQVTDLKRCFATDAGMHGIDFAIDHYKDYKCFNIAWTDECKEEIEKWAKFYR